MKKERRKLKKYKIKIPVESQIVKRNLRTPLTGVIPTTTRDLSLGGIKLKWPKGWKCENCSNCLGWIFNEECRLKADMELKVNRNLNSGLIVKLKFLNSFLRDKDYYAKVVWTNNLKYAQPTYDTGLSFINRDKDIERLFEKE